MKNYEFRLEFIDNVREVTARIGKSFRGVGVNVKQFSKSIKSTARPIKDLKKDLKRVEKTSNKAFQANKVTRYGASVRLLKREMQQLNASGKNTLKRFSKMNLLGSKLATNLGLAFGANQVASFTSEIGNLQNKIISTYNVSDNEAMQLAQQAKTISKQYGLDIENLLIANAAQSKQLGISAQQSFNIIAEGAAKGANTNGELLDILKEYPAQFKAFGLSARENMALLIQANDLGVWSDKAPDALKEAAERIGRMEKPATDALKALGFDPKELQKQLEAGTTSIKDIAQSAAKQIGKLPANSIKANKAIEGIFGTPGVDAGRGFIEVLGTTSFKLDKIRDKSTSFVQAQRRMIAAFEEIKFTIAEAIIPLFTSVAGWVERNESSVRAWGGVLLKVTGLLVGVWGAAKLILGVKSMLTTVVKGYRTFVNVIRLARLAMVAFSLSNPFTAIIAGVTLLITTLYSFSDTFRGMVDKVWTWAKRIFKAFMNFILWPQRQAIKLVNHLLEKIFGISLKPFYDNVVKWFDKAKNWVYDNFINPLLDRLGSVVNWIPGVDVGGSSGGTRIKAADFEKAGNTDSIFYKFAKKRESKPSFMDNLIEQGTKNIMGKNNSSPNKKSPGLVPPKKPTNLGINDKLERVKGDAGRSTNLYLNITKLVETLVVQSETVELSPNMIKEKMTEALLGAVNNVNQTV